MADTRISGHDAGYMELVGAKKDTDCMKVKVNGGISKERGCCNLYHPQTRYTTTFKCGVCEYVKLMR